MFGLSTLVSRIIMGLVAALLIVGVLQVRSCQKARQAAYQSKIDRGQAKAARESGGDALNTQAEVHSNDMARAGLDRTNGEEIHNAQGSDAIVAPDAHLAGLRAACRREAYRNSERCRLLNADAGGLEKAR